MMMRGIRLLAAAAAGLLGTATLLLQASASPSPSLAAAAAPAAGAAARRPHIVFMLGDDVGWSNVGWNNPEVKTPVMDALRASGVKLQRHYAFKFCSPSRASLMSGRLGIHVNQENSATEQRYAGVPLGMTLFPELLQQAGYATHQLGKWHCGMASNRHLPTGRGFNSSLGYFNFGEDHYTQERGGEALSATPGEVRGPAPCGSKIRAVDLWRSSRPAYGENGTYGGYIYRNESLRLIQAHDPSTPLFLFIAWQNLHGPLQVPKEYIDRYEGAARRAINGMASFLDESVGVVVEALEQRGMWENTLLVFCADNGGMLGLSGGNNTPLRGGKFSDFEGGVRVPAFLAGGAVPASMRGRTLDGMISIADWYTTLCTAAGGSGCGSDDRAAAASLPPLDSIDMWSYLTGRLGASPRLELPLSILPARAVVAARLGALDGRHDVQYYTGGEALISGHLKLIQGNEFFGPFGRQSQQNCKDMRGPWSPHSPGVPCSFASPALYDIVADPNETRDIAGEQPEALGRLAARLEELRDGVYAPDRGPLEQAACDAVARYGGYWGPWLHLDGEEAAVEEFVI